MKDLDLRIIPDSKLGFMVIIGDLTKFLWPNSNLEMINGYLFPSFKGLLSIKKSKSNIYMSVSLLFARLQGLKLKNTT